MVPSILQKEDIHMTRITVWGNSIPCVYIAIEPTISDRVRVKVGMSRSMGRRRRNIQYYYGLTTMREQYAIDKHLEAIEAQLIRWLHQAPTNEYVSTEVVMVDYHIAEMLVEAFSGMVDNLNQYYTGRP